MTQNQNESTEPAGFSSSDSVIVVVDGPGDTTRRPSRPLLKKLADAERAKVRRWQEFLASQREKGD